MLASPRREQQFAGTLHAYLPHIHGGRKRLVDTPRVSQCTCTNKITRTRCVENDPTRTRCVETNDTNCLFERSHETIETNGVRITDCDASLNEYSLKENDLPFDRSALSLCEKGDRKAFTYDSNPTCSPEAWNLSIPSSEECKNLYAEALTKQLHKPENWHLKATSNAANVRGKTIAIEFPTFHTHHPFFFFPLCASERRYSG